VNTAAAEYFPSVTKEGTLYFTREDPETRESHIWRSRFVESAYVGPEKLGPRVNSTTSQFNAFIAPDESYLSSRPPRPEDFPERLTFDYLSRIHDNPPNGRSSIYWIDAAFIEALRPPSGE
jgi:hypothetical protein